MRKVENLNRLDCFIYGFPKDDDLPRPILESPLVMIIIAPLIVAIPIFFFYTNPMVILFSYFIITPMLVSAFLKDYKTRQYWIDYHNSSQSIFKDIQQEVTLIENESNFLNEARQKYPDYYTGNDKVDYKIYSINETASQKAIWVFIIIGFLLTRFDGVFFHYIGFIIEALSGLTYILIYLVYIPWHRNKYGKYKIIK